MRSPISAFRGPDGKTALVAVQATVGVLVFLAMELWSFVRSRAPFAMTGFATAFGIVLTASSAAIAGHAWGQAKAQAIPDAPDPQPAEGGA